MPNPYDVALRERAVLAYEAGGGSYAELSAGLNLGQRTLERWVAQHRTNGDVTPKPKAGGWRSPIVVAVLHGVIAERPDATIDEIRRRYNASVSTTARVSWSAMGRALARLGYVLQKNGHDRPKWIARMSARNARRS
jgi:transposase